MLICIGEGRGEEWLIVAFGEIEMNLVDFGIRLNEKYRMNN